jgi:hypothetical protein
MDILGYYLVSINDTSFYHGYLSFWFFFTDILYLPCLILVQLSTKDKVPYSLGAHNPEINYIFNFLK